MLTQRYLYLIKFQKKEPFTYLIITHPTVIKIQ